MKKYTHIWKNLLVLALALVFAVPASIDFLAMHRQEEVVQTSQLTEVKMLSEYCEGLKGSDLDTEIYMFDSGVPGGTFLVLGGTHPHESAGMMSAIAMIENIQVTARSILCPGPTRADLPTPPLWTGCWTDSPSPWRMAPSEPSAWATA